MPRPSQVALEQPGDGLPNFEQFVLKSMLKTRAITMSDRRACSLFLSESALLLEIANDLNVDQLCERVLVPRLMGIEDSSRHWSVLMVLDHLCQVNRTAIEMLELLHRNIEPPTEIDIADFKPDDDVDMTMIYRFEDTCKSYMDRVQQLAPLKSRARHVHPWFGPLTGHQWHCLIASHMRIHRRQAHKITTLQGLA